MKKQTTSERKAVVPHKLRVLRRKRSPEPGVCILIDNGVPCPNPIASRGVCGKHRAWLRVHGLLEEFALPRAERKHRYELKKDPPKGVCRVVVNGVPCTAEAEQRGLCRRHHAGIWQRPDLNMDDFCLPPKAGRGTAKKKPPPKRREKPRYTLRAHPQEGRCRCAVNGEGCSSAARVRGLCQRHYTNLRRYPELLAEIAVPPHRRITHTYERVERPESPLLCCVVIENGGRCTQPPGDRGVCKKHRVALGNDKRYSLKDFLLPKRQPTLRRKPRHEIVAEFCIAVEDGVPCESAPTARGLCKRHYRLAETLGRLEKVALPAKQRPKGLPTNGPPAMYLDKCILFDHADHALFGTAGRELSVRIVECVREGRAVGWVSIDAVKCTYNHARYRLARPEDEGGRAIPIDRADERAREHVRKTFFSDVTGFRVAQIEALDFRKLATAKRPKLSLEDAMEFQTYQSLRTRKRGPSIFVTRDSDFPEGAHPADVVREIDRVGWAPSD